MSGDGILSLEGVDQMHLEDLALIYDEIRQLFSEPRSNELTSEFDQYVIDVLGEYRTALESLRSKSESPQSPTSSFLHNRFSSSDPYYNIEVSFLAFEVTSKLFGLCESILVEYTSSNPAPSSSFSSCLANYFEMGRLIGNHQRRLMRSSMLTVSPVDLQHGNNYLTNDDADVSEPQGYASNYLSSDKNQQSNYTDKNPDKNHYTDKSAIANVPSLSSESFNHSKSRPVSASKTGAVKTGAPVLASEQRAAVREERQKIKREAEILHQQTQNLMLQARVKKPFDKGLSLRQLHDFFTDIFDAKIKADQRAKSNGLSRESLGSFLFTYFNTKYGVKSLVQNALQALLAACEKYSTEDAIVRSFTRMLENKIDEEFRFVLQTLQETVVELFKAALRAKEPHKPEAYLDDSVRQIQDGHVNPSLNDWIAVVQYMYAPNDAEIINNRMHQLALIHFDREKSKINNLSNYTSNNQSHSSLFKSKNNNLESGLPLGITIARLKQLQNIQNTDLSHQKLFIPYSEGVNVLVAFQLSTHEKFLHDFITIFREYDIANTGQIDACQLPQLLLDSQIAISEMDALEKASTVSHALAEKITLSDCISAYAPILLKVYTNKQKQNSNNTDVDEFFDQSQYSDHNNNSNLNNNNNSNNSNSNNNLNNADLSVQDGVNHHISAPKSKLLSPKVLHNETELISHNNNNFDAGSIQNFASSPNNSNTNINNTTVSSNTVSSNIKLTSGTKATSDIFNLLRFQSSSNNDVHSNKFSSTKNLIKSLKEKHASNNA